MTAGTAGARSSSRHLVVVVVVVFFFVVVVFVVFVVVVSGWQGFVTSGLFCACSKRNKMVR